MNTRQWNKVRPVPAEPITKKRAIIALFMLSLLAAVILFRLINVQIIHHLEFKEMAERQYESKREIEPSRGMIYDRCGTPLVINLPYTFKVGVNPKKLDNIHNASLTLAELLDEPVSRIKNKLKKNKGFFWIKREVDHRTAKLVKDWDAKAVSIERESRRDYPFRAIGAQITGFVNVDNLGVSGIEYYYEKLLKGIKGEEVILADAIDRTIFDQSFPRKEPVHGGNVVLSIDINAQKIVEEELEAAVKRHNASTASMVVIRPYTGEIIAMASVPRYDPNRAWDFDAGAQKNRTVTDALEPGSVMKVVPYAALMEKGILRSDELVYCENGRYNVADRTIRDSHPYEWLTAKDVLVKSSNIGTIKLCDKVSDKELYTMLRDFGFNQKTGIELPGESAGLLLKPSQWSGVSKANIAIGQGISATVLQIAMAYGAIANDGWLLKPLLVMSSTTPDGKVETAETERIRKVVKANTARGLRLMLRDAVVKGTGKNAEIPELMVAGKTGTAQKVDLENQRYYKDRYVSSFAGFLPYDQPELLAVVIVDDPKENGHYGGDVAAPVFRNVMKRIMVTPPKRRNASRNSSSNKYVQNTKKEQKIRVPELANLPKSSAEEILRECGLVPLCSGEGEMVTEQDVLAGTLVDPETRVTMIMGPRIAEKMKIAVPQLEGLELREAVSTLTKLGLRVKVEGTGLVVRQTPLAGDVVLVGETCHLKASAYIRENPS